MIGLGSQWRRWEPHIHAPGTILNDQFKGPDEWETYLSKIESATPTIEAIGITDYYVTDTYRRVQQSKQAGRLPNVKLIFPNVELRLDVSTKGAFVNIHLLVSPEQYDHVDSLHRFLNSLRFQAFGETFTCSRTDLIQLGKRAKPDISDDQKALEHGVTQFKVNFQQLRQAWRDSDWARANILVAVAGSSGDGTSGLQEGAAATLREEIESFASIIFASSPSQREFWLGRKNMSPERLKARYGGCKPCLHGSDAHDQGRVGRPVDERYSWVKGAVEFDTLRQACIDPALRAFVGREPPRAALPSQAISRVAIASAAWAKTPDIPLNSGLVAIIGARGSGKTALADIIAAGCDAVPLSLWEESDTSSASFLVRARSMLGDAIVTVEWGGGGKITRHLDGRDANSRVAFPRARYLSQQFVEELCASSGMSDGLMAEIERVIFEAYPRDGRGGAIDFSGLRDQRTMRFQQARSRERDAIVTLSDRIAIEIEREALLPALVAQVQQKEAQITSYEADLVKLTPKGTEIEANRHSELALAAEAARARLDAYSNQRRTFLALQDEVKSTRTAKAPELLRQAQERHQRSGLTTAQWDEFLLDFKGDVDASLTAYLAWVDEQIAALTGVALQVADGSMPLIAHDAELSKLPLNTLTAEMERLGAKLSADKLVQDQYKALSARIGQERATLQDLQKRLLQAQGADAQRKILQTEREEAYGRLFEALINEQRELAALYEPLAARVTAATGTLRQLGFAVRRHADVQAWAALAEEHLLDRRRSGTFQGRGALTAAADKRLRRAWEEGSVAEVQAAMRQFVGDHLAELLSHAPNATKQLVEHRAWMKRFAHWLYDTSHISVRYEIAYDGVEIGKLSPGTRGIVLLLLYLALDDTDDRPLIIDQPEENLDPRSVFDELVPLFIDAKAKRQVVIVTHNANLVINTDADQIIVASAEPNGGRALPAISYIGGGLESPAMRQAVCQILEGGERAFQERARRLRVGLER